MRPLQLTRHTPALDTSGQALQIGGAQPLQWRRSGWLVVDAGQVWITRRGDRDDHVLCAGQAMAVARGQQLVAEPWRSGQVAQLRWVAGDPVALRPAGAGLAWRVAAWALGGVAQRLAAAAREAEHAAGVARGHIGVGVGDGIATASGVLRPTHPPAVLVARMPRPPADGAHGSRWLADNPA